MFYKNKIKKEKYERLLADAKGIASFITQDVICESIIQHGVVKPYLIELKFNCGSGTVMGCRPTFIGRYNAFPAEENHDKQLSLCSSVLYASEEWWKWHSAKGGNIISWMDIQDFFQELQYALPPYIVLKDFHSRIVQYNEIYTLTVAPKKQETESIYASYYDNDFKMRLLERHEQMLIEIATTINKSSKAYLTYKNSLRTGAADRGGYGYGDTNIWLVTPEGVVPATTPESDDYCDWSLKTSNNDSLLFNNYGLRPLASQRQCLAFADAVKEMIDNPSYEVIATQGPCHHNKAEWYSKDRTFSWSAEDITFAIIARQHIQKPKNEKSEKSALKDW